MYGELLAALGQALVSGIQNNTRENRVTSIRRETPVKYVDGFSKSDFERAALFCAKDYPRIIDVRMNSGKVLCTVKSVSGASDWSFLVDFDDWGHFSGVYWLMRDNFESSIPQSYASRLSSALNAIHSGQSIFGSLDKYVERNTDLETEKGLYVNEKIGFTKRAFRKQLFFPVGFNSEVFIGEHLYPMISIVKERGFKKIRTTPIFDVDDSSYNYSFEVHQIRIGGSPSFSANDTFPEDVDIEIVYHAKKRVTLPDSVSSYLHDPKDDVTEEFFRLGFTNIYSRKMWGVSSRNVTEEKLVGRIVIDKTYYCEEGMSFNYDVEVIIEYY